MNPVVARWLPLPVSRPSYSFVPRCYSSLGVLLDGRFGRAKLQAKTRAEIVSEVSNRGCEATPNLA